MSRAADRVIERASRACTLGIAFALLTMTLTTAGCLSGSSGSARGGDGPAQVSARRAIEVAQPSVEDWASDGELAAALALEVPDEDSLDALRGQARPIVPPWLVNLTSDRLDPNVGDGKAPLWVLRYVSEEEGNATGVVVDAPEQRIEALDPGIPLGNTPPLGTWRVNASQAVDAARQEGKAPAVGNASGAMVLVLVPAQTQHGPVPAWKILHLPDEGRPQQTVVDAGSRTPG